MKKIWINPNFYEMSFNNTNDVKPGTRANCNPFNKISWPSGIHGPVWNDGQQRYDCSSRGQGQGVNMHLPDGDINKIPKCPYIGENGECLYSIGVS